jgi:hypothetical protein
MTTNGIQHITICACRAIFRSHTLFYSRPALPRALLHQVWVLLRVRWASSILFVKKRIFVLGDRGSDNERPRTQPVLWPAWQQEGRAAGATTSAAVRPLQRHLRCSRPWRCPGWQAYLLLNFKHPSHPKFVYSCFTFAILTISRELLESSPLEFLGGYIGTTTISKIQGSFALYNCLVLDTKYNRKNGFYAILSQRNRFTAVTGWT